MKKIIIYLLIWLLMLVFSLLKWHAAYGQQDSIIYQEEPADVSDYKPKLFSWSWTNRNGITITPDHLPAPHFTPDIQFYFDGKEFDRRMQKLESDLDRIKWHLRRDFQRELNRIIIDTIYTEHDTKESRIKRIIIEKPHKRKEIIVVPREPNIVTDTPNPNKKNKNPKKTTPDKKDDKKYIQELENKIQQLEKRLEELEKNKK